MAHLPLRGVRVLDFTWHGAGPYMTKGLADHGADVIRVETAKRLDSLRETPPFKDKIKGVNRSGYFSDRNSNKRDIVLNLKNPAAKDLALRLVAQSDVVANNFTPGTLDAMGLSYDACRAVKPDIIYVSMSVHGNTGPDRAQVGYGLTVSALSGLYHLSGAPGRPPVGTGTNFPDHISAPNHTTFAVLAALRHRRRTGEGQQIDVAMTETMVALLGPTVLDFTVNGHDQVPRANRVPTAAPHGVYPCQGEDRWIGLSASTDAEWTALVEALGAESLAADPRFATVVERHRNQDAMDAELTRYTCQHDATDLMQCLQARGVPAGVVQTMVDVIDRDPQLRARGHFAVLDHPEMGPSIYNAPPFRLRAVEEPIMRSPAPLLGQHTREVCRDLLGLDDAEIDRLVESEVLV